MSTETTTREEATTITDWVAASGITAQIERIPFGANPPAHIREWRANDPGMSRYRVTMRTPEGDQLQIPYYCGSGIKEPPTLLDVLASLQSDAASVCNLRATGNAVNADIAGPGILPDSVRYEAVFKEWADLYGYATDSRKAEATFREVQRIANRMIDWLGVARFREFINLENDH